MMFLFVGLLCSGIHDQFLFVLVYRILESKTDLLKHIVKIE